MSSDNVEKLSAIIPEAWFDLIDRVVPGTVIVLASFPTDLVSRLSGLSFGGFAVGLVVAYVVGFVFEIVSDLLFGWVPTKLGRFMDCYPNRQVWEKIHKQPSPRREIAAKISAEGAMFKSLWLYELLQILLAIPTPTGWYSGLIPRAALNKIWVHPWQLSVGFAVVAFVCWVRMQCVVTGLLKSWESTPGFFYLRLMYSESDVSSIPTSGTDLVIVADVMGVLYFRIFGADGKVVVDTNETRLTTQAGPIADLKRQLDSMRPPHKLTRYKKDRVVTAVTSIVGHNRTPSAKTKVTSAASTEQV